MDNLVNQGFELALFGMGTVFVFLAVLIAATKAMSFLVLRFEPVASDPAADAATQGGAAPDATRLVAIISAAIAQHRNNKN